MKKVFLTEPIHQEGINLLKKEVDVIIGSSTASEAIIREAAGCQGIIIRSAKITGEIIKSLPKLKVIAKHGIGVDNIDLNTASEIGVMVVNAPEANIHSVAEHALGMILAVTKNFVQLDQETRKGNFHLRNKIIGTEIMGKTVGLVGMGKIGLLLAQKLGGLGVKLIGYDPYANPDTVRKHEIALVETLDELLANSDIITIHTPLTDTTKGMISEEQFNKMKNNAYLINVSRGSIVDEQALYQALKTGQIRGAALDVFEEEPPAKDNPLFTLDNILVSPHNAALTEDALIAMAVHAAQGVLDYINGKRPKYVVNPQIF
ncbi:MAG: hydroxyacid dehydrogenase [Clostridia bacterium]|nr:hydroxyacid dehydrogenase [Clostridia bacterium]